MDLNQYRTSRIRRWLGFTFCGLIFGRSAFLLGAKLYFGVPFKQTDFIVAVIGLGSAAVAYLYLKDLLWPKEQESQDA